MGRHNASPLSMKTANGIYYNLKESEYQFHIDGVTFFFSSRLYYNKFAAQHVAEMDRFNAALMKVYKDKFSIDLSFLALVRLYTLIEKRGFHIIVEGVEVTCPEDLHFAGMMILKNRSAN